MKKTPFLTLQQAQRIKQQIPTPFHIYDEAGIRKNARALKEAFSWNKGFREYFAVKATPNPYIVKILKEEGCGCGSDLGGLGLGSAALAVTLTAAAAVLLRRRTRRQ